jgi:hypothetical protein
LGAHVLYIVDSIVSENEQRMLLDCTEAQYRHGGLHENPRDPGAHAFRSANGELTWFTRAGAEGGASTGAVDLVWVPRVDHPDETAPPEEFWKIRSRVVDLIGLSELEEDHYKDSFLSYIAPGAGIHRHLDARLMIGHEEVVVLRCNVLLKRPQTGGLPMIGSTELEIPNRGMWVFYPTELFHSATAVGGTEFRGLQSFGYLVRPDHLWRRKFRAAPDFIREFELESGIGARRALVDHLRAGASGGAHDAQFDVLDFALLAADDFTPQQAVMATGQVPEEAVRALEALQRAQVVESHSSRSFERGRVTVI